LEKQPEYLIIPVAATQCQQMGQLDYEAGLTGR